MYQAGFFPIMIVITSYSIHYTKLYEEQGPARRLMAILLLHEGRTVCDVHLATGAARSTIGRWLGWYQDSGLEGLKSLV